MVGWRYNVADNDFEIAPYYNVDFARILPNENPNDPNNEVIKVPIGQSFNFAVDYSDITLTYGNQTVFKPIPADLPTNQLTAFRIQPWSGGTSLPPNSSRCTSRQTAGGTRSDAPGPGLDGNITVTNCGRRALDGSRGMASVTQAGNQWQQCQGGGLAICGATVATAVYCCEPAMPRC